MKLHHKSIATTISFIASMGIASASFAEDRVIQIAGIGTLSGVIRSFGINSQAALGAATDKINQAGGIPLADGTTGKFQVTFYDDRCNAEEGISVVRRVAATQAIIGVGPSCSNVAESLFGVLQRKVGDASDSGLQFPMIADVAAKGGLAKISEWSFRNVPNESDMYKSLFEWLRAKNPELKTVYGGFETDFAHSNASYGVMKTHATANGFTVLGQNDWLLNDTTFSNQVREMRRANPDIVAISAHPFTTCGVLREMGRQGVKPKILIGLTSSSSLETLKGCGPQAEGMIIPTGFAPINDRAIEAARLIDAKGGSADLHSAAAFEIMYMLKDVIEAKGILGKPDTVQEDRVKMRQGLSELTKAMGLLGPLGRTSDREAIKPFVYVQAKNSKWEVLYNPIN